MGHRSRPPTALVTPHVASWAWSRGHGASVVARPDEVPQWARHTKLQIYSQEIEQDGIQLRFFENLDHQLALAFPGASLFSDALLPPPRFQERRVQKNEPRPGTSVRKRIRRRRAEELPLPCTWNNHMQR